MSSGGIVLRCLWAVEIALAVAHVLGVGGAVGDATYVAGDVLPLALVAVGLSRAPRGRRLVPALLAVCIALAVVGDTVLVVHSWVTGDTDRAVADGPYFVGYASMVAAMVVMTVVRRDGPRIAVDAVLDVLALLVVSTMVVWSLTIDQLSATDTTGQFERLAWIAYPVLDALLLGLAVRALGHRRTRRAVGLPLAAGIWTWILADISYYVLALGGTSSAVSEVGWMLCGMLLATASLGAPAPPPAAAPLDPEHLHTRSKLLIANVPLLAPITLGAVLPALGLASSSATLVGGSVVLISLTFVRTQRLLTSESEARAELAAARDEALAGSRAKSDFLATMSHEIRTPMNGVIGLTGLLLDTGLDDRQRTYAEGVRTAGDALLMIINDILDFSKVEAGHLELETIDFDPVQLVDEVAELVAESASEKRLELLASCSPGLPARLRGDPARLRQVLLNLAGNAVKFTETGEVVLRAMPVGTARGIDRDTLSVRFEVRDTGIGVDTSDLTRLFDPFSQADSSTTRRYGGTGLGLAICRQLVEAMGGAIGVDSELGHGSTFWFTLPLGIAADEAATPAPQHDALAGRRVLVVDDNRTNRLILEDQLTSWGMTVDAVDGGSAGLAALRRAAAVGTPYDLGVLDLCMPGMSGLDLARLVADSPELAGTVLVLLTSSPAVGPAEATEAGFAALLSKPVPQARLRRALLQVAAPPPAKQAPPSASAEPREPERAPTRGRVLVVEDGDINQVVAEGVVRACGFDVDLADDGRAALDAMAVRDYDLVFMDVHMPVMDGLEATREIRVRETSSGRRTPVIAMTASAVDGDRERCLEAGMDDFVSKPISKAAVAAALERWVDGPAAAA